MCCATKRQVEIACPSSCGYFSSGREHPAAVVRRRQQRDADDLLPTIRHLTERQYSLFFLFHSVIARFTPEGLSRLVDDDVTDATAAVAATLETSTRGVICEHSPPGLAAQALTAELKTTLDDIREQRATVYDHEAAVVLRVTEAGARSAQRPPDSGGARTTYLDLLARLLNPDGQTAPAAQEQSGSRLILA